MRIYYITKGGLLRLCLLVLLVCIGVVTSLPYKEQLLTVFNANREIPIYSVDTPLKKVAITFDCAWGGDDIPQIIEVLRKYNAKATFFCVGTWLDKYPDNVKALNEAGHEIANHSDTHADATTITEEKIKTEITNANNKITNIIAKENNLFRAPYGAYNDRVIKTAKSLGQYTIQWDVDSLDWKELGVDSIVNRIKSKTKNGSILLFHNDTKYTLQALPAVLEYLQSQGYSTVTTSELIIKDNYYIDNEGRQHSLMKDRGSID